MRFSRTDKKLNNYSDDDEEFLSSCKQWRLIVPHVPNTGDDAHYGETMPRQRPTIWVLHYEVIADPENPSSGEIGCYKRRKDAVAKAVELRQGKINELVAGMV